MILPEVGLGFYKFLQTLLNNSLILKRELPALLSSCSCEAAADKGMVHYEFKTSGEKSSRVANCVETIENQRQVLG